MLLRFSVENFRSFKDRIIFSMAPNNRLDSFKEHIIESNGAKILKAAFIYGANASGKSNFIKAIDFAKSLITEGFNSKSFIDQYFRIDKTYLSRPGTFQFEFTCNNLVYSYGFSIQYNTMQVISEWLFVVKSNGSEKMIFERENNEVNYEKGKSQKTNARLDTYIQDLKTIKPTLFLTEVAKKNVNSNESIFFKTINAIYKWFTRIVVVFPNSRYSGLLEAMKDVKLSEEFTKLMVYFDTGLKGFKFVPASLEDIFWETPEHIKKEIISDIKKSLIDENVSVRMNNEFALIKLNKSGEFFVEKLKASHGRIDDLFDLADESDGTNRLFDLVPLLFSITKSSVIFIDELDRSLHPKLVLEYVNRFFATPKENKTQLIATTHQAELMDLKILRRDEIWLVDRCDDGTSNLYSLDEFKLRSDKDVNAAYLLGRYGAVPVFGATE